MTTSTPDTIVLIHDLWMTPRSWERWIERYESHGYTVIAPSWPGLEGEVEALRRDPSPLADLSAAKILAQHGSATRCPPRRACCSRERWPTSRTPFRVDWRNRYRAPMLFIGGSEDHVVPAKVSRKVAAKAAKSGAVTEYKEFAGRSHFIAGEPGWEEVADFALDWATEHAGREQAVSAASRVHG